MDNKKLKFIVRELLEKNTNKCRDNDLFLSYLVYQKLKPDIGDIKVQDWYMLMYKQKLPPIDSILRCRRRLQQLYPDLRGKKYIERITTKQTERKRELGYV